MDKVEQIYVHLRFNELIPPMDADIKRMFCETIEDEYEGYELKKKVLTREDGGVLIYKDEKIEIFKLLNDAIEINGTIFSYELLKRFGQDDNTKNSMNISIINGTSINQAESEVINTDKEIEKVIERTIERSIQRTIERLIERTIERLIQR
jgi:hypothetical protein